jgi:hypothetical protein
MMTVSSNRSSCVPPNWMKSKHRLAVACSRRRESDTRPLTMLSTRPRGGDGSRMRRAPPSRRSPTERRRKSDVTSHVPAVAARSLKSVAAADASACEAVDGNRICDEGQRRTECRRALRPALASSKRGPSNIATGRSVDRGVRNQHSGLRVMLSIRISRSTSSFELRNCRRKLWASAVDPVMGHDARADRAVLATELRNS